MAAIGKAIVEVHEAEAQVGLLTGQRQLALCSAAAGRIDQALVLPHAAGEVEFIGQQHASVHTHLAAAPFDSVLLADPVIGIDLAGIGDQIDAAGLVLHFGQPALRAFPLALADSDFGAHFGVLADPREHVDRADIGALRLSARAFESGIADCAGADADLAVPARPVGARARVPFSLARTIGFELDDDELRIEVLVAAQHRGLEADRAGQQVELVIGEAGQRAGGDDLFGAEAVAHFQRHALGIGEDAAAGEAVGPSDTLALDFLALEAAGDFGCEALRLHTAHARLAHHPGGGTIVGGKPGLVEGGLEIAIERIETGGFDADIQLLAAGGIELARRGITEHGVIGVRIDRAEHALVLALLGAVIGEGQQILPEHAALGIERDARIIAKIAVELAGAFHVVGHRTRAHGAFGKADHSPFDRTRFDPGFQFLAAGDLAIVEGEVETQRAADHGRGKLDLRDAFIALHHPARRHRGRAGELVQLLAVDLFGALVGGVEGEAAGNAFAQRAVVAVQHADRHHRAGAPIGDEVGLVAQEFDLGGRAGEEHLAGEGLGDLAEGIEDARFEHGPVGQQGDTAPLADGPLARLWGLGAFKGERFDRLAIDEQLHGLAAAVAHGNLEGGRARVGIGGGREEAICAITQGDVIGGGGGGVLGRLASGGGLRRGGSGARAFGQLGMEIGDRKAAALAGGKARDRAARAAGGAGAIDEAAAFGQGHRRNLHHVGAGDDAFEVVAPVAIGDREAAVFQHNAHARNAATLGFGQSARALGDAADDGHAVGDPVTCDVDGGIGAHFAAQRVAGYGKVDCAARRGVGADAHRIGHARRSARRQIAEGDGQGAAVGRDGHCLGCGRAVHPDTIRTQAQPARGRVGERHAAAHARGIGVADGEGVEHHVTGLDAGARCGFHETQIGRRTIHRQVDLEGHGGVEHEDVTEGTFADHIGLAVRARDPGEHLARHDRGGGVGGGRLDREAEAPLGGEREPEFARGHREGIACAIGDGLAAHHAGRPRRHAVGREDDGGGAGIGIDQRHARAADRFAGLAVEDHAEGVDQHGDVGRHEGRIAARAHCGHGDTRIRADAEAAVFLHERRRDAQRIDHAGKDAAVGLGLEHGHRLAITFDGGEHDGEAVDCSRIAVGGGGVDLEKQGFAAAQPVGLLDGGG